MRPIVFLHIPKTAGQNVHFALAEMVGARNVSPIRVNGQAAGSSKLPPGYLLHSGHIDWIDLEKVAGDPFVFTVLRDPAERIGSFYFYMLSTAQNASPEEVAERRGLRRIRDLPADAYFFEGDAGWIDWIRDHYFNFYCSYLATRRMLGRRRLKGLESEKIVAMALQGAERIDRIYSIENLAALEDDIERIYGWRINVANRFVNTGELPREEQRWLKLLARLERDASRRQLESFVEQDRILMQRLAAAGRIV